jgi:cobalt/nickel transport system permease protein
MTLAFRLPPCTSSPVSRLDPRWKLAALLAAATATATLHTLPPAALALAGALCLAVLARLPWAWYRNRLAALALFLAFFTLPLPWLLPGETPRWSPLPFSLHGVHVALLLSTKAVTIVTLLLVVQATAPLDATLKAAHALRIPGLLVQLGLLSYRYLFVLADELARLRIALRVRGYRNRATRHSYRTAGHVVGTLLVRGFERAERVGQAMRCRGFQGRFHTLTAFDTRPADILAFLLIITSAAALCCWDWLPHLAR